MDVNAEKDKFKKSRNLRIQPSSISSVIGHKVATSETSETYLSSNLSEHGKQCLFVAQREVRTQKVHELTLIRFVDKHDKAMLDSETMTLSRQCEIQWKFIAFLLFVSC